MYKDTDY